MACHVCERAAKPRAHYCPRCREYIYHKPEHLARKQAMKLAYDKAQDAFICHYTGILLDEHKPHTPWNLTFDHVIPGKKGGRLVVASSLINDMKSDMSEDEFIAVIREFASYKTTGSFNKDAIHLEHWYRLVRPSRLGQGPFPSSRGTAIIECVVCHKPSLPGTIYCERCRKFVFGKYEHMARQLALKASWNQQQDGFLCHYTGVRLDENDPKSPWYVSFDHSIPGKKGRLVVCARFINTLKANLTETQFLAVMAELAKHLDGAPFDKGVLYQ